MPSRHEMDNSKIRRKEEPAMVAMSYLSRAMMMYEMDDNSSEATPPSLASASTDSQSTTSSSSRPCLSSGTNSLSDASTWRRKSKKSSSRSSSSSGERLRSNLLFKLGVATVPDSQTKKNNKNNSKKVSLLGDAVSYRESIKFGDEDPNTECVFSPFLDEQDTLPVEPTKRSISFNEEVNVVPIPSHTDYSDRVRQRLWMGSSEIYANAQRNTIEFASECCDWRTVKEEEQFIRCQYSGNLTHPVHFRSPINMHNTVYQPN